MHKMCILGEDLLVNGTRGNNITRKATSSLLKLANCSMHGGETWCACVLHRFHDDHDFALFSSHSYMELQCSSMQTGTSMFGVLCEPIKLYTMVFCVKLRIIVFLCNACFLTSKIKHQPRSLPTDARSLIQWLLEFRAQDRPNLEQILKHPWLKSPGKSPHSPSNNKISTTVSSPQTKQHLISPSSRVSPSATKPQSRTSSLCRKETTSSPSHGAGRGSRGAGTPSSPSGSSSSSYFTPPQGRTGVKYSVPMSGNSSPDTPLGNRTSSPLLHRKNGGLGCCLPSVVSARNVSPSSGHGGSRGPSLHRVSPTTAKSSKSVMRRFVSPVPPPRGPTSHYGGYNGGGSGVVGTTVQDVTGTRGGERLQPEASRTQLLVGRKQAF